MSKKKRQQKPAVIVLTKNALPSFGLSRQRLAFACGLFAFLLYANTLGHQFTVDDDLVIVKNKFTHEGISAIPKIFTTSYRAGFYDRKESLYRPLSVVLFAVEWQVAADHAWIYHLVNVLLYALTAFILFLFLSELLGAVNIVYPLLITLLFIAHPVHTEVIANVKSGDEVLSFLFSILSLWLSVRYIHYKKISALILSAIFFLLALLSKETAVSLLILIPLTLWYFSSIRKKDWFAVAAIIVIPLGIYLMMRFQVLNALSDFSSVQLINNSLVAAGNDWFKREATAITLTGKYIFLLFIPYPLCYDYSYNTFPIVSFTDAKSVFSLVIIIALAVVALRGLKNKNPVSYGIFFFAVSIAIVSNMFFLIESTFAERFLYMPSLGFSIALTYFIGRLFKIQHGDVKYSGMNDLFLKNRSMIALFSILLLLFSIKTFGRNFDWKNNFSLLQKDVKTHPQSARIRYSIGSTYVFDLAEKEKDPNKKMDLIRQGIQHLKTATDILPDYGDGWFNLGIAYNQVEDFKAAEPCFDQGFLHTEKQNVDQLVGAGVAYGQNSNYQKALQMFHRAEVLDDTSFDVYNNLGLFQSKMQMYDSAIINLNKAIRLKPENPEAYYNLGNVFAYRQNFSEAIKWYQRALKTTPDYILALENMGNSYAALQQYGQALEQFQKVLTLEPGNQQARYNAGITYRILGDTAHARLFLGKQ